MNTLINKNVTNIPMENRELIQDYAEGRPNIINLSIGNPDLSLPPYIAQKAMDAIAQGHTRYTGYYGTPQLKAAIAKNFKEKNQLDYDPEKQIVVTQGVTEGMFVVIQALLNLDDEIIIPTPHYAPYEQAVAFSRGKAIYIELLAKDNYSLDLATLEETITPRTKAIIFCNPSNPLGDVWDLETLQGIAHLAQKHDLIVISDEIYDGFVDVPYPGSIASLEGMAERTIVLNGFSKLYCMTGFRVGYMAGPENIIEEIKKLHYAITLCPNSVSQKAAEAALECPQDELDVIIERFRERRRLLCEGLERIPKLKYFKPVGGLFACPDFYAYGDDAVEIGKYLVREAGVMTLPMNKVGSGKNSYIRLSTCASEEEIVEALKRIKGALEKI